MTKSLNFDAIVANKVMTFWLISTSDVQRLGTNKVWKKNSLTSYSLTKCLFDSSSLNF